MTDLAAIRAAHPVVETQRCGNRISEPEDRPPGPPNPPTWCARLADGHRPEECVTPEGRRLTGYAWGGLSIEERPPVLTYRCETCCTPQDHKSPTPCATLRVLAEGEQ